MRYRIRKEGKEKFVDLFLEEEEDGIHLCAEGPDDAGSILLKINELGITLAANVDEAHGLPLRAKDETVVVRKETF